MTSFTSNIRRELQYIWNRVRPPRVMDYYGVKIPTNELPAFQTVHRRLLRKTYESGEIEAAKRVVRADSRVTEFGSGLGIVAMSIAKMLNDSTQLVSYEANAALRPNHEVLCTANGVSPILKNAALGVEAGEATFNLADNFLSSSLLSRPEKKSREITVPQITLDQALAEHQADVIICDIEGGETLFQNVQFPDHVRAFSGEFHPHIIGDAAVSNIVRNLLNQGFELLAAERFGWVMCFERPDQ